MNLQKLEQSNPAYQRSLDCVHCGLCLPACPTYQTLGQEKDSPRGRILLMRAVAEGEMEISEPSLGKALDNCLDCRACESACPSGVQYGEILETFRVKLVDLPSRKRSARALGHLLDNMVASKSLHRFSMSSLRLAQVLGLQKLATYLPLPRWMKEGIAILPRVPRGSERSPIPPGVYEPVGTKRAEVALFTGCMMETLFGRVNRAALRVLQAAGCRVHVPEDQGCCGALHLHAGLQERARPLALRNLRAFPKDLDAIILTSAGCGSAMKEYPNWLNEAKEFSAKVKDFTEFLADLGLGFIPKPVPMQATWDDPCHLCHGQGICHEPRQLLNEIPQLNLIPLDHPEDCCGSAGIYSLQQPELAHSILARKIDDIKKTGVRTLITANPGCHLWIESGLRKLGESYQVLHIAEVLARGL